MDDDMKELHHDNYSSQSEMQEWLEANREIYTGFKSKIQSILKNLLCDNHSKQIDDETNKLQSIILEIITTEEGVATDELIDKFFLQCHKRWECVCLLLVLLFGTGQWA